MRHVFILLLCLLPGIPSVSLAEKPGTDKNFVILLPMKSRQKKVAEFLSGLKVGDKVEIRPMMYLALTYDHRIIDGREAVQFLVYFGADSDARLEVYFRKLTHGAEVGPETLRRASSVHRGAVPP